MSLSLGALTNYVDEQKIALLTKAIFGAKTISMMMLLIKLTLILMKLQKSLLNLIKS